LARTDQTVLQPNDCYDLSDDCVNLAINDHYCRDLKYAEWMSQACKESCNFCVRKFFFLKMEKKYIFKIKYNLLSLKYAD